MSWKFARSNAVSIRADDLKQASKQSEESSAEEDDGGTIAIPARPKIQKYGFFFRKFTHFISFQQYCASKVG